MSAERREERGHKKWWRKKKTPIIHTNQTITLDLLLPLSAAVCHCFHCNNSALRSTSHFECVYSETCQRQPPSGQF